MTSINIEQMKSRRAVKRFPMLSGIAGIALLSSTILAGHVVAAEDAVGYIYTTLNGTGTNMVVAFDRQADGALTNERAFSADSKGGADPTMGGDAAGDFDSQGGIDIVGNYLLNANAGGNTISVFELDRKTGDLKLKGNTPSGGARPVSIAVQPKAEGSNDYWVVVANQMGNPNVQKGGAGEDPIEFYPNKAFFAAGGDIEKVAPDRNIALMSFDGATGELTMESVLATYNGVNGGPDNVEFSPDGTKLALATWGVAHFGTMMPTEQRPSRVYVYDFDAAKGAVDGERHFEERGIAGSIGFSWNMDSATLYVSNFNLMPDKLDNSVTVLKDDGKNVTKAGNFGTGDEADGGNDEACWTVLSPDGKKLYVASFTGNIISEFNVASSGELSIDGAGPMTQFVHRPDTTPKGDTKDMYLTDDGKHLYVNGAYQSFTTSQFNVADNGDLTLMKETRLKSAPETAKGAYNFLGMTGFSK